MFGMFKTKRGEQKENTIGGNIIDFELKRREKRCFQFFKPYQFFGKPHEFSNWVVWQQRKK